MPDGALIISFEIHPDSYSTRRLSAFDYYISTVDVRCSWAAVSQHLEDGPLKGVHCAEPGAKSSLSPRLFWQIYKTKLMGYFHVGVSAGQFLGLLRERGYDETLVERIAQLPSLENAALEFCDNVDLHNGTYVRSAFYGFF